MNTETVKSGIYPNISNADYHAGAGLSSSDLKLLARSPLHYINSKNTPRAETPSMKLGTAVHCAILEPDRFKNEYIQAPELDKRSKAGKEAWTELENSGKIILTAEEYNKALEMSSAVHKHALAGKLFTGGTAEQSVYWRQPVFYNNTEILCKCRPDYVKNIKNGTLIIDLKTTRNAATHAFKRQAFWDLEYHVSAAHYMTGLKAVIGKTPDAFIFVAVENEPPYAVSVFRASDEFLERGRVKAEEMYELYAKCSSENDWHGYPETIQYLDLPKGANY